MNSEYLPNEVMTFAEVMAMLDICRATLNRLRRNGEIPSYRFGRKVYFRRSEIISAMEANRVNNSIHA